jgi:large subunit ribosomal protein L2
MNKSKSQLGYKPYTASRRFMTREDYSEITEKKPYKKLLSILKKHSGRDKTGKISVHHQGGRSKRMYRIISSLDEKLNVPATVKTIEYDPNRSARIMLVQYEDGAKRYLIAPFGIKVGAVIIAAEKIKPNIGNRIKLENIPTGTEIYDIQMEPGSHNRLARSAGCSAMILAQAEGVGKRGNYIQVRMPSGEIRLIHKECFASIGKVSNINHSNVKIGKAGRMRWMGIRPTVRGKAKNPVDHPHGGGEGGNSIGLKYPKTPWGKPAMGKITRKNKRTRRFIVKRRYEK